MNRVFCSIVVILFSRGTARADQAELRRLFDAIRSVESGGSPHSGRDAIGDNGRSLGPYQIRREYWKDSGLAGRYSEVRDRAYAEEVMLAYWKRHCPLALARRDFRTLARIHNGGPAGNRKTQTLEYWRRVDRNLHPHGQHVN